MPTLAQTKSIKAYFSEGKLYILAEGDKPTPCYIVSIVAEPMDVFPPIYKVQWYAKPGICAQHVTPYRVVSQGFSYPEAPASIKVHHLNEDGSDKVDDIQVQPYDFPSYHPVAGANFAANDPLGFRTATGVGDTVDSAIWKAIGALGSDPNAYPDKLYYYDVINLSVETGGIDGRQLIRVTVRG